LGSLTGVGVETVFDGKQRRQSAAQIFDTLEADARTLRHGGVHAQARTGAGRIGGVGVGDFVSVGQAGIDDAVDGDTRRGSCGLRMRTCGDG